MAFFIFSKLIKSKVKDDISAINLPGTHKKSFAINFCGGEIWIEHLDGMYSFTDKVIQKFINDIPQIAKNSAPSLIAINLDETIVNEKIVNLITDSYIKNTSYICKVVFVGLDIYSRRLMKKAFKNRDKEYQFAINYINDFEKAKKWLIGKEYN